jgi:hypothetical protein
MFLIDSLRGATAMTTISTNHPDFGSNILKKYSKTLKKLADELNMSGSVTTTRRNDMESECSIERMKRLSENMTFQRQWELFCGYRLC